MFKLSPVALGFSLALAAAAAQAQDSTGPQSSQTPYVVPTAPGWEVVSLLAMSPTRPS
ncbi:MAG: hypothetical protein J0I63_15395 [Thiobacillus sp.]|nr:hypothetical protein [Thiobacillus sp.]